MFGFKGESAKFLGKRDITFTGPFHSNNNETNFSQSKRPKKLQKVNCVPVNL